MADRTGNDVVDAALDRLARSDPREADTARIAFTSLTAGAGPEIVTFFALCDWLWRWLPSRWAEGLAAQLRVADALGALFELLEMPRYAEICTAEITAGVLAAWSRGRKAGITAMSAAHAACGARPPDIPGLLAWGEVMGEEETAALHETATRLEMLIAAGEFGPGTRGWRKAAQRATAEFVVAARDDLDGDCWLHRIHTERLDDWVRSHGSPRGRLAAALARQLAQPAPVPRQAPQLLKPVSWLLGNAAADGVPLTQNHTLARAVVGEGCERFGWLSPTGRPRSESDVTEAWTLRTMMRELGAVRRQGRKLRATSAGKKLASAKTAALWSAVAPAVLPANRAEAAAGELALMLLLADRGADRAALTATVADGMATEGWHRPDTGQPIDTEATGWLLGELYRRLHLLGLLEQRRSLNSSRLTPAGRAAAHAALRAHALRPRSAS